MDDAMNEDLVQQVLKLVFAAGDHGMTRDELVDATGADPKAIDEILKRLGSDLRVVRALDHDTPPLQSRMH
jgi:hypothetical protein